MFNEIAIYFNMDHFGTHKKTVIRIKIIQISCQKEIKFNLVLYSNGLNPFRSTFDFNKYNIYQFVV